MNRPHFRGIKTANMAIFYQLLKKLLAVLFIPFIILVIVYFSMTAKISEQAYEQNLAIAENSVQKIEMLFDNLDHIEFYLGQNLDVQKYFYKNKEELNRQVTDMVGAQQQISAVRIVNSDILNVQIYSNQSDTLIDAYTSAYFIDRYYGSSFMIPGMDTEKFRSDFLESDKNCFFSDNKVMTDNKLKDAIVYNKSFMGHNSGYGGGRIIFYLLEEQLLKFFEPVYSMSDGFINIYDENGNIIMNSDTDGELSGSQNLFDSCTGRGYKVMTIDGRKMFVTFFESSNRGWKCIEAVPQSRILEVMMGFRHMMQFMIAAAAILGILLIAMFSLRIAVPMGSMSDLLSRGKKPMTMDDLVSELEMLVSSNQKMKEEVDQTASVMRRDAFYRFLCHENKDENAYELLNQIGIDCDKAHYALLLLNCNDIDNAAAFEEISAQKVFLENVIKSIENETVQGIYHIDMNRTAILLASDGDNLDETAEKIVEELLMTIEGNYMFSISVGGDCTDSVKGLPKAYIHAQRALGVSWNVFGAHKVQWYDRANRYLEAQKFEKEHQDEGASIQNLVLIDKVKGFIVSRYNDPQLSLSMVSDEFAITEAYLSKLFKRVTGQNFSKYIEAIRMEKAKGFIDGGCTVTEAAEKAGYNSVQVFRRAWKRYYEN